MVEGYAYVGSDFRGDLDLPLFENDQWDKRGKKDTISLCFYFILYLIFL